MAEIAAAPEDDAARLVWADAEGGERGELVVLQCELARGGHSPAESGARRRRQRELLASHGREWSGLAGIAERVAFRRGFVDAAAIKADTFVTHADRIFAVAPLLRTVEFGGFIQRVDQYGRADGPDPLVPLRALLEHPGYRRLVGAGLSPIGVETERESEFNPYGWESRAAEGLAVALEHDAFSNLQAVDFAIDSVDATRVVKVNAWQRISRARIGPRLGEPATTELFRSMSELRALDFRGAVGRNAALVAALPHGLTELRIGGLQERSLAALAETPLADTVEVLFVHHIQTNVFEPLATFSKLRSLHLSDLSLGSAGYSATRKQPLAALCSLSMPALRELHISASLTAEELGPIAAAFGPQLELLDLRGARAGDVEGVRTLVAGDLVTGAWIDSTPGLHASHDRAPAWDPPALDIYGR